MPQVSLPKPRFSPLAVLTLTATLSAAFFITGSGDAHARSSKKSRRSKTSQARKSSRFTPRPVGVWAWTAGSRTYIRVRPSTEMPPVAKVPRHTRVMVWGKYNGWYRVETGDGKFGWVRTGLVSSPKIAKVKPLSHTKAKRASNRTGNQVMYGSAEDLKKYYRLYGASGAKKGLANLGVAVGRKSKAKSQRIAYYKAPTKTASKTASRKSYSQRAAQQRIAQQRATQRKMERQKAAQAKANKTRWAALRTAELRAAKAKQARYAAIRAAQQKAALAKATQARLARQKAAQRQARQARAERLQKQREQQARQAQQAQAQQAQANVAATTLQPSLPNSTKAPVSAPRKTERLAPAIPLPPQAPRGTGKGNFRPNVSPEDLIRARDEHLKRSSSVPQDGKVAETSKVAALPPLFGVYYITSAVYAPSLAGSKSEDHSKSSSFMRGSLPAGQFSSRVEHHGPKSLIVPLNKSLPIAKTTKTVVLAKNAPKAAKPAAKKAAKAKSKTLPHRGGSPRDLARLAQARFGEGVAKQALSYRGRPYIRGAASPSRGFDCSGLIYYLLRQRGYNPPRTAAGLARYGKPVPPGQLKSGDLVLFANTYKRGVSHVGIYMGNNNFVHAATSGTGVRVDSLGSAYYCRKYYGARRVELKK